MARHVITEMNKIFTQLENRLEKEHSERINHDQKRNIQAYGNESFISKFVKDAKIYCIHYSIYRAMISSYKGQYFLLMPNEITSNLNSLNLKLYLDKPQPEFDPTEEEIAEIEMAQACQMLAISNNIIQVKKNIESINIFALCFDVEPDDDNDCINYDFLLLRDTFFEEYSVYELDATRFDISYIEDIDRLFCYCLAGNNTSFTPDTENNLKQLALLQSSRGVASLVLNSISSQLLKYSFLQLYQCLEYLFIPRDIIDLVDNYGMTTEKARDWTTKNEIKITEREHLKTVLLKLSDVTTNLYYSVFGFKLTYTENGEEKLLSTAQKIERITNHIYDMRCSIAHMRYGKALSIENTQLIKYIEAISIVIQEIYSTYDNRLSQLFGEINGWKEIPYKSN